MMNLSDTDVKLLDELERLSRSRLLLSKSLETAYTKQLSYINDGNIDSCLDCIKTTDDIFAKLHDVNDSINQTIGNLSVDKKTILNALYFENCSQNDFEWNNDIIENFKISNKVLKNCNILNERLCYKMLEASDKLQTKLNSIKKRKLIEQSYGRTQQPKIGNVIDYKNT